MLAEMARLHIEKSVVLATPDHPRYTDCKLTGNNRKVEKLVSSHPDRFIGALYIEPRNVMEAQTAIRRYYDKGFRLVKIWPGHGYSPDDPMIYPVWDVLHELKMGVILHSGSLGNRENMPLKHIRSSGFNAKFGQPFLLDQPARFFPDLTFIIAHAGYPWTLEALEMSFMFKNIYLDFSCQLGLAAYDLIGHLRPDRLAWERILFGSDTAGVASACVEQWTRRMAKPFFKPHKEDFFYNNARNLLGKLDE